MKFTASDCLLQNENEKNCHSSRGVSMFVYLLSIIENEEIISMISNYFCPMLGMGRQQLPNLKMEKRRRRKNKNKQN